MHKGSHNALRETLLPSGLDVLGEEVLEESPLEARPEQHRRRGRGVRVPAHTPQHLLGVQVVRHGLVGPLRPPPLLLSSSAWRANKAGSEKTEATIGMPSP